MKFILRNVIIYSLSLFLLQLLFSGVTITGGSFTHILAGAVLTVLFYTIKPLLQLISLPLNMATLGLFTVLINTFILYITAVLIPNITITSFVFEGFEILGFIIPEIAFNTFFAYVICALVISCITSTVSWLFHS